MASSISPTSSTLKHHQKWHQKSLTPKTFHLSRYFRPLPLQSVAPDAPADLSRVGIAADRIKPIATVKPTITKDPVDLWHRYVDWLFQHKEIGLYLDVSRIGFTDEFLERMEPRMQRAFEAMTEPALIINASMINWKSLFGVTQLPLFPMVTSTRPLGASRFAAAKLISVKRHCRKRRYI